ncbi:hypothetical protein ACFQHO_37415 [Actinomadura yumaensis]|uniref:hypothetical protein n=1 Tax=Actinomadura TaxID=1988 RepID=UPI001581D8E0|nr:hypothetical protein [Actinomadura sp. J1-007]
MTTTSRRPPGSPPPHPPKPRRSRPDREPEAGDAESASGPAGKPAGRSAAGPAKADAKDGAKNGVKKAAKKRTADKTGKTERPPASGRAAARPPGASRPKPAAKAARSASAAPAKAAPGKPAGKAASAETKTAAKPGKPAKSAAPAKKQAKAGPAEPRAARRGSRPAPRAPFVLLILGLLGGALVSLLLLNTVLAEDAFTLTRLQQSNKLLGQQRQALQEQIAREESPGNLARRARAQGMRPGEGLAFIDSLTGQTTGGRVRPVPQAAAASAGAAGVVGIPGTVVPGDGVPPTAPGGRAPQPNGTGTGTGSGTP